MRILLALALSLTLPRLGAGEPARGRADAVCLPEGPKIDGTLADPAWAKAPLLTLGKVTDRGGAEPATTARVLLDAKNLYLGFSCEEPDTAGIKKTATERDGAVWNDDCVEIFVSAEPGAGYRHIAVNAAGAVFDQSSTQAGKRDPGWNGAVEAKAAIEEGKRWTATLSIPLKDLDAYVGENLSWLLNLTRTRSARGGSQALEASWAILPNNDFHQPGAFGHLYKVTIPEREDGVTRKRDEAIVFVPVQLNLGTEEGGVTLFMKQEFEEGAGGFEAHGATLLDAEGAGVTGKALRLRRPDSPGFLGARLATKLSGSRGVRIACHLKATGAPRASVTLYDSVKKEDCVPFANRWTDAQDWTPLLFRVEAFKYDKSGALQDTIRAETLFETFVLHGGASAEAGAEILVDNLVVYRDDDRAAPERVAGLKAEGCAQGVKLSWQPARDNVAVMCYAVARAQGEGPFAKIAETIRPEFTDPVPAPGRYRYRVLACDFEENLGAWSEALSVEASAAGKPPEATREERERQGYRERVLAIAAKGAGKANPGRVVCYGDQYVYAPSYRLNLLGALGTKLVSAYGHAYKTTTFGRENAAQDLGADSPAAALIHFGALNGKSEPEIVKALEDFKAMAQTAAELGVVPIFGTLPPRGFGDAAEQRAFSEALAKLCQEEQLPLAHIFEDLISPPREQVLEKDGLHLTKAGMEGVARAWQLAFRQVQFVLRDRP